MKDVYLKEIEAIVQKAGIDGTLRKMAVEQFDDMVKENVALKEKVEQLEADNKKGSAANSDLRNRIANAETIVNKWEERESELATREKAITALELNAAHQAERVKDHKEMFTIVFRNTVLRKDVLTAISGTDGGQYQSPIAGTIDRDTLSEEEG